MAYDYLGVLAYYEGNMNLARHYHDRLIECDVESTSSATRELGIKKFLSNLENKRNMRNQIKQSDSKNSSSEEDENFDVEFKSEKLLAKEMKLTIKRDDKDSNNYRTLTDLQMQIERGGGGRNFKPATQKRFNQIPKIKKINEQILKNLLPNIDVKFKVNPLTGDSNIVCEEYDRGLIDDDTKRVYIPGNRELNHDFKMMKYTQINKSGALFCHLSNLRSLNKFHSILTNTHKEKYDEGLVHGPLDTKNSAKVKLYLDKFYTNIYIAFNRLEFMAKEKRLNAAQGRRAGIQAN